MITRVELRNISKEQIASFTAVYDHNNRPVEALNKRTLYLDENPSLTILCRQGDELTRMFNDALGRSVILVTIWARAHRRLAAGVTDPARIDLGAMFDRAIQGYTPRF